jgi:tRNA-dihydrouridine synthase
MNDSISMPILLKPLQLRGRRIAPSLFLAPMAGITHCAFRRLVADFGGYGAMFTEMLSAKAVLRENLHTSPFTKRRECEGALIYQLALNGEEDIARVIDKLKTIEPFGIDINLGCPAPEIRSLKAGIALFRDHERCAKVLETVRAIWDGPLTIKCRLGDSDGNWEEHFARMAKLFEGIGIDAITVHPRFSDEKLKRTARASAFSVIRAMTSLPIIANGDIVSLEYLQKNREQLKYCSGIMIGRMAVVKPWIFAELSGGSTQINYPETWKRFYSYVMDDFPPEKAIGRLKEFTSYFAQNFFFGNVLFRASQSAKSPAALHERAVKFLDAEPRIALQPSVIGI